MIATRSNSQSATPSLRSIHWTDAIVVGFIAFALRAVLIVVYPFVYGGDPIIRLIESERILLSYQLPGLQAVIYVVHALGGGVVGSRLAVAALSALAAAGLCRFVATRWSRGVAFLAGLIFACNPYVVYFSTVPYQFPLVLAAVHWGLYFYVRGSSSLTFQEMGHPTEDMGHPRVRRRSQLCWLGCSMCIGIACLTRYEAWIFAACVAIAWILSPKRQRGAQDPSLALRALIGVALFGWGPITWLALHRGITPTGTFVIEGINEWGQLLRPLTTGAVLLGLSGPVIVVLSVVGVATAWRELRGPRRAWWLFAAVWLVCSSIGLVFSAHSVEPPSLRLAALLEFVGIAPTPGMFVTPREGHLYVSLLSILAALGVARIAGPRIPSRSLVQRDVGKGFPTQRTHPEPRVSTRAARRAPAASLVVVLLVGHSVWITADRIKRAGRDPELQTAVAAARVLDALLDHSEPRASARADDGNRVLARVLILAKPIPPEDIDDYLLRAKRVGGAAGERRAREILATIETGPPAYQRLVVHSRYDRARLLDMDDVGFAYQSVGPTFQSVDDSGEPGANVEDLALVRESLLARNIRYCIIFNDFVAQRDVERAIEVLAETGRLVGTIDAGVGARVYAIFEETK